MDPGLGGHRRRRTSFVDLAPLEGRVRIGTGICVSVRADHLNTFLLLGWLVFAVLGEADITRHVIQDGA